MAAQKNILGGHAPVYLGEYLQRSGSTHLDDNAGVNIRNAEQHSPVIENADGTSRISPATQVLKKLG